MYSLAPEKQLRLVYEPFDLAIFYETVIFGKEKVLIRINIRFYIRLSLGSAKAGLPSEPASVSPDDVYLFN